MPERLSDHLPRHFDLADLGLKDGVREIRHRIRSHRPVPVDAGLRAWRGYPRPPLPADPVRHALAAFDDASARVVAAVHSTDLATPVPIPDAPWNPQDVEAWSVRWVWFHLIEELARHAGHADIIREGVDGATLYELLAAHEGWPETDWLKPWKPAA